MTFCCACQDGGDALEYSYPEDGQVNSAPKSSIPFAAAASEADSQARSSQPEWHKQKEEVQAEDTSKPQVTPEVASAHPVDTRETAAQGMNVAPMQGGDTAGQNYEVKQKEWEITLKREKRGELVGLVLEQAYDFMCVRQQPQKGLAKAWNTSNPSLAIRPGDILQEVNGICGIGDDVLKQLKASDEMKIKIRRFLMFKVSVPVNAEETLGLHLSTTPEGEVAVAEVHANGAVKKYNMTCGAGTEILAGDIIVVCVGFNSTSAQELRTHLAKVSGTTELWIRRPN